ncbi:hypothetical protein ABMX48_05520 [Streptomyces cavourensis]
MSDEKQPELTPAEQQKQDEGRVKTQLVVTDATELGKKVLNLFAPGGVSTGGRTSFEGHDLNAIIDLVENSNPADLENAGEALWKARDAIRSAAKELGDHIDGVDWQGESGEAFRKWGKGLANHATKLSDFADAAGTQITVAGTGLASVRNSMPPRDRRMIQTDVDDILFPARTETNPVYAEAMAVEKNRQEAINQINRLASYYAVSEEVLAAQEPPRFDQRLGIDMPPPRGGVERPTATTAPSGGETLGSGPASGSVGRPAAGISAPVGSPDGRTSVEALGSVPVLDKSASTEINSVSAPTMPNTTIGTAPTPSANNNPGPINTPTLPVATGFGNQVPPSPSRATGPVGVPRSASQSEWVRAGPPPQALVRHPEAARALPWADRARWPVGHPRRDASAEVRSRRWPVSPGSWVAAPSRPTVVQPCPEPLVRDRATASWAAPRSELFPVRPGPAGLVEYREEQ